MVMKFVLHTKGPQFDPGRAHTRFAAVEPHHFFTISRHEAQTYAHNGLIDVLQPGERVQACMCTGK